MTLFQDNHKLVKARFLMSSWMPFKWIFTSSRLRNSSGYVLRSVHTFSWFLKSNWYSHSGHAETGSGAKKREVLRREFFCSKFKVEWENGVWTKIRFIASGFFVHISNFTLILFFFRYFGLDFFLNGFPNPFKVRSWSSFLISQWIFFELCVRTSPAMFFLRCVHTFFNDFDLSKRDKQVTPSGHSILLEARSGLQ